MIRRSWKAITIDWSAMAGYDDIDLIPLCLTQRQVAILKALLIPAYWPTRWDNLSVTKDVLVEYISDLDAALIITGTCGAMVDCNDVDTCLETSKIIDTLNVISYSQQRNATQAHLDDLNATYDGTPQSVAPDVPTTAPDTDAMVDNALCYVVEQMVNSYAATKAAEISLKNNLQGFYQDVISAMRNIAPILPDWLFYLLGDELFGCVADFSAALVTLTDTTAKIDLACCLRDELRAVVMSQTAFDAAIATCVANLSGEAGNLACLFSGDNSLSHYLSFLTSYNQILVRQQDGDNFVCQCAPPGWFWVDVPWSFSTPNHGGVATSATFTHTNPLNGTLFAFQLRQKELGGLPIKSGSQPGDSGGADTLTTETCFENGDGLLLFEQPILGVKEGSIAVGWPPAQRMDTTMVGAKKQPGATWSVKLYHCVDFSKVRQAQIGNVRLLYKDYP